MELKRRLVSSPILAMPRDEGNFRLDTDASNEAIGAVLSQVQDGQERVVCYASRLLNRTERNYCVTRRELLAVVFFIKQFRNYLLGRRFLVRTDHSALRWLRNLSEPIGQQARWLETLEEFEFDIEHRPGKRHGNADALSRRPCRQCSNETTMRVGMVTVRKDEGDLEVSMSPADVEAAYAEDPQLSTFYDLYEVEREQVPWAEVVGLDRVTKELWQQWNRMDKRDGRLYRRWVSPDGLQNRWQLVPPKAMQGGLLRMTHEGMTGGHLGVRRSLHQLQRRAYWPG